MRHRFDPTGEADSDIHYEGDPLIGHETLCGHVDRQVPWEDTTKRVNCKGCLSVRDHVLGRK